MRYHAFALYLYLASNADGYELALSPTAINMEIGMARSTYHDQLQVLINKGYLVRSHGNTYEFFEKPQPRPVSTNSSSLSGDGLNFDDDTIAVHPNSFAVKDSSPMDTEINNIDVSTNKETNIASVSPFGALKPKDKEFVF